MILNAHSYYSLRYGVIPTEQLVDLAIINGYDKIVLTDINNSTGVLEFVKICKEKGLKPIAGMEFRSEDDFLFVAIAKNNNGYQEINELLTNHNLYGKEIPARPDFTNCYVVYPFSNPINDLKEYEFIGVRPSQSRKLLFEKKENLKKFVILHSITFKDKSGFEIHKKLRAVSHNCLLSQLEPNQLAYADEYILPKEKLLECFGQFPVVIKNTEHIINNCDFEFDFKTVKNKKT